MKNREEVKEKFNFKIFIPSAIIGTIVILVFTYCLCVGINMLAIREEYDYTIVFMAIMCVYCLVTCSLYVLRALIKRRVVAVAMFRCLLNITSFLFPFLLYLEIYGDSEITSFALILFAISLVGSFIIFISLLITVCACKTIRPDRRKMGFYGRASVLSVIFGFFDVVMMTSSKYPISSMISVVFLTVTCVISIFKICCPIPGKEYNKKSDKSHIQNSVKYSYISKLPTVFLFLACLFALAERILDIIIRYSFGYGFGSAENWCAIGGVAVLIIINFARVRYSRKYNRKIKETETPVQSTVVKTSSEPSASKSVEPTVLNRFVPERISFENEKDIKFSELIGDFKTYISNIGISAEDEDIRKIFGAIMSRRVIFVHAERSEDVRKIMSAVSTYFGTKLFYEKEQPNWGNEYGFVYDIAEDGSKRTSVAINGVYNANLQNPLLSFVEIDDVNIENLSNYFYNIAQPITDGDEEIKIFAGKTAIDDNVIIDKRIAVPENLYFVFNVKDADSLIKIGDELSRISCILFIGKVDGEVCEHASSGLLTSLDRLKIISENATENYFVAETYWRSIDSLSKCSNYDDDCKSQNRISLAVEKYIATYLAFGGREKDAVDNAVASIIVTEIIGFCKSFIGKETEGLSFFIDKHFGTDNMPQTQKIINIFRTANATMVDVSEAREV